MVETKEVSAISVPSLANSMSTQSLIPLELTSLVPASKISKKFFNSTIFTSTTQPSKPPSLTYSVSMDSYFPTILTSGKMLNLINFKKFFMDPQPAIKLTKSIFISQMSWGSIK